MKPHRIADCGILTVAIILSRFLFRSRYLYDVDSVNFALALDHFDPVVHQPHPPGYFLYVCVGRLVRSILPDANDALVAISVLASCAAVVMIYLLADEWFGRPAAIGAGLIFVFSPLSWFHGVVALTYMPEVFFSALVGYLCWRTRASRAFLLPSALALGVAAGFRQSAILFLAPTWLFSLRKASRRRKLAGFAVLVLSIVSWFVPMMLATGGITAYFSALYMLWRSVPGEGTVFTASPVLSLARALVIAAIYLLCFGVAAPLLFGRHREKAPEPRLKAFIWIWLAPGLLFFTLVFFKFVNSGYLLVVSPPVLVWVGAQAAGLYRKLRAANWLKVAAVVVAAALNTAVFLRSPFYWSYRSIARFETELVAVLDGARRLGGPRDTLIVGFDSHFLGFRHAGYYLPDYQVVLHPEARFPSGKRVFAMKGRRTQLAAKLPAAGLSRFVLFPLPSDDEYAEHIQSIQKRFPAGALRSEPLGGHLFLVGSTSDLRFIFPTTSFAPTL